MNFIPAVQPLSPPSPTSWCLMFIDGKVLLPEDEGAALEPVALAAVEPLATAQHYLGRLDSIDCWTLAMSTLPIGWRPVPLRAALMQWSAALQGLASRAAQVLEWDRAHRFCGVCATPTQLRSHERSRECPNCGQVVYPRISPAMMVLVWRGRELLLARAPHFNKGMYSALAGFVEAGESIEECIVREVAEEVGVGVRNIRYYGSQSWPFPQSLMIAYTAEWAGGEIVPQPDEIEEAAWYDIDALPGIPPRFSIAGHLIRDTVDAMRNGSFADAARG